MTTETMSRTPVAGARVLLGAALVALLSGAVVVLAGAVVAGTEAAYGAVVGTLLAVTVFAFGSFVVNAVAGVMPSAALLVAMLTYTLQVVVMGLVFWAVTSSPRLDAALDQRWLGGAAIVATLGWLVGHTVLTVRQRIPAYDLAPSEPVSTVNGVKR